MRISEFHNKLKQDGLLPDHKIYGKVVNGKGRNKGVRALWRDSKRREAEARQIAFNLRDVA